MIIILSSPSGGGKSSAVEELIKIDSNIVKSISVTTRPPRNGEQEGVNYFFIDKKDLSNEHLIESAKIYGNYYGTPKKFVLEQLKLGKDVIFDIDWQGAKQIIAKMKDTKILSIFIMPPSMEELERRLRLRGPCSEEVIQARLKEASKEMTYSKYYNHIVVNHIFDKTIEEILSLIKQYRMFNQP